LVAAVARAAAFALCSQRPQSGGNRRFLEAPVEPFAHGFRCDRAVGPNQLHHLALEVAQIREGFIHYVSRLLGGICVALQRVAETPPRRNSPAEARAHCSVAAAIHSATARKAASWLPRARCASNTASWASAEAPAPTMARQRV